MTKLTDYFDGYIDGLRVEDNKPDWPAIAASWDFNDRITLLHTELVNLTNDAMASNCPLALVDRLMDAEQVLDVVADYIKGGPRVPR